MNELRFARDKRSEDPNENAHRKARFREGWRKGAGGQRYSEEALEELTWENLGYRLGALFTDASPQLVDEMYDWCVRQQREQGPHRAVGGFLP